MTLDQIQALTDDEIRVKVAELTGDWKNCRIIRGQHGDWDDVVGFGTFDDGTVADTEDPVPNYPADLNACHEFEATLSGQQWPKYVTKLCGLTRDRNGEGLVFATARQRCEAFIAVMTP